VSDAPPGGTVRFIQHHVPVLEAGDYDLTATIDITVRQPDGTSARITDAPTTAFAVYGERFALDPSLIESVYPPANTRGEYDNVLPHAVFTRRTLPWERTANADGDPHVKGQADVAPWLALLLFDETELDAVSATTTTVGALLPAARGGTLPPDAVSSLSVPNAVLDDWEKTTDACQVLDVPVGLFSAAAPTLADLKWLAHARQKTVPGAAPADPSLTTDHAVVIGNRLPRTGHTSTVFLVSLEQLGDQLPADDSGAPSAHLEGIRTVRLVTLLSWRLTAVTEEHSFKQLLEDLNDHAADDGLLRLPQGLAQDDDADRTVSNALARGFVPLAHTTRQGDRTVSWYRGPLAPHAAPFELLQGSLLPATSADAVASYDPDTGMFDTSLAAAWQAGRLLALADRHYATALYAFKRELHQENAKLAAGGPASRVDVVGAVTEALTSRHREPRAKRSILDRGAHLRLLRELRRDPAVLLASLRATAPATPPAVVGWLARLMLLQGLPFDYLVADDALLPPESIRFFTIDRNWQAALLDGAISIGRNGPSDLVADATLLRPSSGDGLIDQALAAAGASAEVQSGFLLRSEAVSGWWPGIRIDGYPLGSDTTLPALRVDRVAPTVLICLFDGALSRLVLHEPPQGMHFGLDRPDSSVDRALLHRTLRYLGSNARGPAGSGLPADGSDSSFVVQQNATDVTFLRSNGVLKADRLAVSKAPGPVGIRQHLIGAGVLAEADPFTAAELALELIEGVDLVTFVNSGQGVA
jgi:hypothetical protein